MNSPDPAAAIIALLLGAICSGPFWLAAFFTLWTRNLGFIQRTPRMEYKINLITKQLGIEDSADADPILRELWRGNKIGAIKLYRERTGVGLQEAKDVIDALERGETVTLERENDTA